MTAAPRAARIALERYLHLHMAAHHAFPHRGAQRRFHRVEFQRHVEVHVQAAVIDGFDGKRRVRPTG